MPATTTSSNDARPHSQAASAFTKNSKLHSHLKRLSLRSPLTAGKPSHTSVSVRQVDLDEISNNRASSPAFTRSPTSTRSTPPSATSHRSFSLEQSRPRTSNDMDSKDRQRLLKSAQKLTRILGETPILCDTAEFGAIGNVKRARSLTKDPHQKPVMREMAMDDPDAPRSLHRHRPQSFDLPSTSERSALPFFFPFSHMSTVSSPTPARQPPVLRVDCDTTATKRSCQDSFAALSGQPIAMIHTASNSSPAEPLMSPPSYSPTDDPIDVRRIKMAKLSRHLGENVPAELVFPPTPQDMGSAISAIERRKDSPIKALMSRPSLQTERPRRNSESTALTTQVGLMAKDTTLRRTQTMRVSRRNKEELKPRRNSVLIDACEPLSKRQKAINVKRASKMTQLFGTQPPHALFQITNIPNNEEKDDVRRHSHTDLETLASTINDPDSAYEPLSAPSSRSRAPSEVSAASAARMTFSSSQLTDVEMDNRPIWKYEQDQTLEVSVPTQAWPATPTLAPVFTPDTPPPFSANFPGIKPTPPATVDAQAPPPSTSTLANANSTTAADTAAAATAPNAPTTPESSAPGPSPSFHTRRRRVAKLSRFFGVAYHDLVDPMVHGYWQHHGQRAGAPAPALDHPRSPTRAPAHANGTVVNVKMQTDVRMDGGSRPVFWGRADSDALRRQGDMIEVIGKLREL